MPDNDGGKRDGTTLDFFVLSFSEASIVVRLISFDLCFDGSALCCAFLTFVFDGRSVVLVVRLLFALAALWCRWWSQPFGISLGGSAP